MRVILYGRVSTDKQNSDMQLQEMRSYCEQRGWEILKEIQETDSGANSNRPRRQEILLRAFRSPKRFDAVMVWKLDRWSRSSLDLLQTLSELTTCGIAFISITEGFDLTTPMGKAMAGMLGVFAQFERDMIAQRVKTGIDSYREREGKWGRPSKRETQRETIKRLFGEGQDHKEIAALTELSESSVYRILREEDLIGRESIYFLDCGDGLYKVGRSADVEKRIKQLGKKIERSVSLIRSWTVSAPRVSERALLEYLTRQPGNVKADSVEGKTKKIYLGHEFFNLTPETVEWLRGLNLIAWVASQDAERFRGLWR